MARPRIHHVSIPRLPHQHEQACAFYGDVLGFPLVQIPHTLSELDLTWFQIGDGELHLYGQEFSGTHMGRHLCIEVADLAAVREQLRAAGYNPEDTVPIPNRPRFICEDPFGNLLEFTTILE